MSTEPKKNSGGPGGPGRHGFRKPKNTKKTLFRMFSYLSGNVPLLTVAFIMIILSALAGVAASYILKPLINNLTSNLKAYIDSGLASDEARRLILTDLGKNLAAMGAIYLTGAVGTYVSSRVMVSVAQKTANR